MPLFLASSLGSSPWLIARLACPTCLRTKSSSRKDKTSSAKQGDASLHNEEDNDFLDMPLHNLTVAGGNGRDMSLGLSSKAGGTVGTGSGTHSLGQTHQTLSGSAVPTGGRSSQKTSDALLSRGSDPSATLSGLAGRLLGDDPFLNHDGIHGGGRSHLRMLMSGSRSGGGTVSGSGARLDLLDNDEMFPVDDQELLHELMMDGDEQPAHVMNQGPDGAPPYGHQVRPRSV